MEKRAKRAIDIVGQTVCDEIKLGRSFGMPFGTNVGPCFDILSANENAITLG